MDFFGNFMTIGIDAVFVLIRSCNHKNRFAVSAFGSQQSGFMNHISKIGP